MSDTGVRGQLRSSRRCDDPLSEISRIDELLTPPRDFRCRERYGIGALLEKIRWDAQLGIIKTDEFRISNDFQSCYVRYVLMRDPTLCGVFKLSKTSDADPLVVDGGAWTDFAKEHEAELWP